MIIALPYPISANRYWRPVRIGAHITIVPTKEAKAYKREVEVVLRQAAAKPIAGRVAVVIHLYPHRPLDWPKRAAKDPLAWDDTVQCLDLDNANKVVLDALKGLAFDDDSWVRRLSSERMEPDAFGARVVVQVEALPARVHPQVELLGELAPIPAPPAIAVEEDAFGPIPARVSRGSKATA